MECLCAHCIHNLIWSLQHTRFYTSFTVTLFFFSWTSDVESWVKFLSCLLLCITCKHTFAMQTNQSQVHPLICFLLSGFRSQDTLSCPKLPQDQVPDNSGSPVWPRAWQNYSISHPQLAQLTYPAVPFLFCETSPWKLWPMLSSCSVCLLTDPNTSPGASAWHSIPSCWELRVTK